MKIIPYILLFLPNLISATTPECRRYRDDDINISISPYERQIDGAMDFSCSFNSTKLDLSNLSNCSFPSVTLVKIKFCIIDQPVVNILSSIGVNTSTLKYLILSNIKLKNLRPDILNGLSLLETLFIYHGTLESISEAAFSQLGDLKNLHIRDKSITTLSPKIFSSLLNLKTLVLQTSLTTLPDNLLENNTQILDLRIFSNFIHSFPANIFSNLVNLKNISLFNNDILFLNESIFAQNINLERIDLKRNNLTTLPELIFTNCSNLKMIDLSKNYIANVPENIFKSNKKLQRINLSDNLLTNVSAKLIHGTPELEKLYLSNNEINSLPKKFLQNGYALVALELDNNLIEEIPGSFFSTSTNLKQINLNNNNISFLHDHLFSKCLSLEELLLSGNKLKNVSNTQLPDGLNSKLKYIDISHNELTFSGITFFGTFFLNNHVNIVNITLSHNRIEQVPYGLWSFLRMEYLDLSYNSITDFYFDYLSQLLNMNGATLKLNNNLIRNIKIFPHIHITNEISIFLANNPFFCNCYLHMFASFIQGRKSNFARVELMDEKDIKCSAPDSMLNKSIISLNLDDLTCELSSGLESMCSDTCDCTIQPNSKKVFVSCSNRNLISAPLLGQKIAGLNYKVIVDLSSNTIKNLSLPEINYADMTELNLSNNSLDEDQISKFPFYILDQLKFLNLRDNKFVNLPDSFLGNLSNTTTVIDLSGNDWECNCDMKPFHTFVQSNYMRIRNVRNITCRGSDFPIQDLTVDDICTSSSKRVMLIVFPILAVLIAVVLTVSYYQYKTTIRVWLFSKKWTRWLVTEEIVDADKEYDAFISYAHQDEEYVNETLLPGLEQGDPSYKVCLHYRDWIPGELIQTQIIESVKKSRRTIVILSTNFINSVWTKVEFREAHHKALEENTNRVIVIVYGEMPPVKSMGEELKHYVNSRTYLQWDHPRFWDNLKYAMPHKSRLKLRQPIKLDNLKGISNGGFSHIHENNKRNKLEEA